MILFLSLFFVIYGAMHWFFYRLLVAAWSPGRLRLPVLLFLGLMVLSPPLVRILEGRGWELSAQLLARIGYSWMGFIFLFCVIALVFLVLRLPLLYWGRNRKQSRLRLPGEGVGRRRYRGSALICGTALVLALGATVYGYREARLIGLEEVRISSPKLLGFAPDPTSAWPEDRPLRIVMITDVHLGLIVREQRLAPMLAVVRQARPDILVATGDIVDGQGDGIAHLAEKFQRISAPLGKFAILGNHEFYVGAAESRQFLEAAGFTVLRGESVAIGGRLRIAGVDDRTGIRMGLVDADQEQRLLAELPADTFNILLKHQPEIVAGGPVDLQLSGHVHGGQLLPFKLFTWLAYRVPMGLSRSADGRYLYVGRGSGTWGPPIRFLAPPEITLIELEQSQW